MDNQPTQNAIKAYIDVNSINPKKLKVFIVRQTMLVCSFMCLVGWFIIEEELMLLQLMFWVLVISGHIYSYVNRKWE